MPSRIMCTNTGIIVDVYTALFMGVLDEYIEEKEGEFDDTMTIQPKSKLNPAGVRSNNQHN